MSDPKEPRGLEDLDSDEENEPERKRPETARDPRKYVFKIVPADPKNSLSFEDVADK